MKLMKYYLGIVLVAWFSYSWAADAPAVNPELADDADKEAEVQVAEIELATDPDEEAVPETEEEQQSSTRFIPTEQISQDLGVSFPVDI